MSSKALAVWLGMACVLIGLTLVFSGRRAPGPTPPPAATGSLAFSPGMVVSILLEEPGAPAHRVERGSSGEWFYVRGELRWPAVVPETALAALGVLADEIAKPADQGRAAPTEIGQALTIGLQGGEAVKLSIAKDSIGGRSSTKVESAGVQRVLLLDSTVLEPLVRQGPGSWRSLAALPEVKDSSRIHISSAGVELSLAKVDGSWSMRAPISARVSPAAVATLIDSLSALKIARFDDRAAPVLEGPAVILISIERDERTIDGSGQTRTQTIRRELRAGGAADPAGQTRYAAVGAGGEMIAVIPSASLSAVSLAPRNYLAPTAIRIDAREVFMIVIRDLPGVDAPQRGYRRDGAGWGFIRQDGSRAAIDAASIDGLLEFLTERPGEPDPAAELDGVRALRRVELIDSAGDTREIATVGYSSNGEIAVRVGQVLYTYPSSAAPALLELPAFGTLPPESGTPAAPELPAGSPVDK